MGFFAGKTRAMITKDEALAGRTTPLGTLGVHRVLGHELQGPYPKALETATFAMGCFWGAERLFWQLPGVYTTAVGYCGGYTPNPTYEEVCGGRTGHAEAVLCVFDPKTSTYADFVRIFFEGHDPTQGMRQGNDRGTQYRSAIYFHNEDQATTAKALKVDYDATLRSHQLGPITTEIEAAGEFYFAEDYHQQYLAANPNGYCGLGGTGVACPVPMGSS